VTPAPLKAGDRVRFASPFGGTELGRIEELDDISATVIADQDETLFVLATKDLIRA
jgi:hypothetical protein